MTNPPGAPAKPSRMDALKGRLTKAILIFVAMALVFMGGALALYFGVSQQEMAKVQIAREEAVRGNVAMRARARAVEARYALTVMDVTGAKLAAADVRAQLAGLAERIPAERTLEAGEVKQLVERAALVEGAFDLDPNAARKDLEVIEAKLATLYPAIAADPAGPAKKK